MTDPVEYVVVVRVPPPREPTILEMMLLMRFFMSYGRRQDPGINLLSYQLTEMPDSVGAYWLWMHTRLWA